MKQPLNISDAKANVNCQELAENFLGAPTKRAGRARQWPCPFHQDGASPSFTVYEDGFHCFGCGASGDAVDLLMQLGGLDFMSAIERFTGASMSSTSEPSSRLARSAEPSAKKPAWQKRVSGIVDAAVQQLASPEGQPGRDYLTQRGFEPATWQAWRLGFKPEVARWEQKDGHWVVAEQLGSAITVPWIDGEVPVALQYRLIEHKTLRYWQQAGGDRTIFGRNQLTGKAVLLIVEGELNAVSVWQAANDLLDVVSYGSESNISRAASHLRVLAKQYRHVIFWADKEERAREAVQIGKDFIPLKSPRGLDANDLLCRGSLRRHVLNILQWIGAPAPDESTPSDGAEEHVGLALTFSQQASLGADEDGVQPSDVGADDIEAQLERLLAELGQAPGKGMEFARPGHPGHETYRQFCELERRWMSLTGRSSPE